MGYVLRDSQPSLTLREFDQAATRPSTFFDCVTRVVDVEGLRRRNKVYGDLVPVATSCKRLNPATPRSESGLELLTITKDVHSYNEEHVDGGHSPNKIITVVTVERGVGLLRAREALLLGGGVPGVDFEQPQAFWSVGSRSGKDQECHT